ncbi:hypothetical protein BY458DRAFT_495486, partial [Sporodiniella umbellata]
MYVPERKEIKEEIFNKYEKIREYMLQWCSTLLIPGDGNNVPSSTFMRNKPNAEAATPHLIRARTSLIGITQEPDGGVLNTDDTDPAVWSRIRVIKFKSHFIDKNEIDEFIQEDIENYKK